MKERSCEFCTMCEDRIAWFVGFVDGLIAATFYSCSKNTDNANIIIEMTSGFKEGARVGHLDK